MVFAGGCVQTGSGLRRYVNPKSENSDRLYHGLIWIPGVISDLVHIEEIIRERRHVVKPSLPKDQYYIRLGCGKRSPCELVLQSQQGMRKANS